MDIAARDLQDPTLAEGFFRRARAQLSDRTALARLQAAHDEILQDFR